MTVNTNVFLGESEIRNIIEQYLNKSGYELVGELEIVVKSKLEIPQGAIAGDVVGINAKVKKNE